MTYINTPEQNGVSERKNRHLLKMTKALLFQMNVLRQYWSDAILTATYLINRLPSVKLENKSPLEILYQRKLNIDNLRTFGCVCFVHKKRKDKFDSTSTKAIFLGYSTHKKGYKCYDPINKKNFISSDVVFNENETYFLKEKISKSTINSQSRVLLPTSHTQDVITLTENENGDENNTSEQENDIEESNNSTNDNHENDEESRVRRSSRRIQPSSRL
jgi:hypothetical protein